MFKLIAKRGKINFKFLTTGLPIFLEIDTLECKSIWYSNHNDLERDDDVILVGYMGTDEFSDPQFYICAYFNITKKTKSSTKQKLLNWLLGSIIIMLLTGIYWNYILKVFPFILIIPILTIVLSFFLLRSLVAYRILEKEIRKL